MWGYSIQSWQSFVFWLWVVTAVCGGLAVTSSLLSSVVADAVSNETQKQAEARISEANLAAEQAKASAAQARSETVQAMLATERLRLQLASYTQQRVLTESQRTLIADMLKDVERGTIRFAFQYLSEGEIVIYAQGICEFLESLGFNIPQDNPTDHMESYTELGLKIVAYGNSPLSTTIATALRDAFARADIPMRLELEPESPESLVQIYIGPRF